MPGARLGTVSVAVVAGELTRSPPLPATGFPSGPSRVSDELAGSIASVKASTSCRGEVATLALAAGTDEASSACASAIPPATTRTTGTRHAAATTGRRRRAGSVLGEEGIIAVALEPAAAHETQGRDDHRLGGSGRHEARQARPDLLGDRKSTRLNSSHVAISYAVFCLKKKNKKYQ